MTAVQELQRLLTTPPPHLTHSSSNHLVAHAALQALRDSGDEHFLFLRCIVELQHEGVTVTDNNHRFELLFHCITGCRQTLLWKYHRLPGPLLERIRDNFFQWGTAITNSTLKMAFFSAVASFWKRAAGAGESFASLQQILVPATSPVEETLFQILPPCTVSWRTLHDLFAFLETTYFPAHMRNASLFLDCLVSEFNGTSAVSYHVPLEFHMQAHKQFEGHDGFLYGSLHLAFAAVTYVTALYPTNLPFQTTEDTIPLQLGAVIQLCTTCLTWHFGNSAFAPNGHEISPSKAHIVPPSRWRTVLGRPDICQELFRVHNFILDGNLAHNLRELLMYLASLSGPIFANPNEKLQYASLLCQGSLTLLQTAVNPVREESLELLDALQLTSRLIANFRLSTLIQLPLFGSLLQRLADTGGKLLEDHVRDCQANGGNLNNMECYTWREENLSLLLECAVLLCEDPWLLFSGTEQTRLNGKRSLSSILGPLFEGFVRCRTRMAAMEEHYLVTNETDLDEVREDISEKSLEEEMESLAAIGRLNLGAALACLSSLCGTAMPRLQTLWESNGALTPEAAGLLEESRLLIMYVSHLLTDSNEGESPAIPGAVLHACRQLPGLARDIAAAVEALLHFAQAQTRNLASNPSNQLLSPLMAKSFLTFLDRWAPAYIYPVDLGAADASNGLVVQCSSEQSASHLICFIISLCLSYQWHWPHEPTVQETVGTLLLRLSKRGSKIRPLIVASPGFRDIVRVHCVTAGIRHSASQSEFESVVRTTSIAADMNPQMVWGYHRLPYKDKSRVLTAILVACGDSRHEASNVMLTEALKAVHGAFSCFVDDLASKRINPDDVHAKESASLCIELFCGVVNASEMIQPERIPEFLSSYLAKLSGLMTFYAMELTICEALLRLFRDYAANFLSLLDQQQSLILFQSSAQLLKGYSAHHCSSRVITKHSKVEDDAQEEQAYSDILCAIQLLINLGTKEFIDACNSRESVDTAQVTDIIFFGLQQILPVMTKGLLQFPTLCVQFFELVGFAMDAYPEKLCVLPLNLFESLSDSLLFGISHQDVEVAKNCFQGLASIAREQLQKGSLKSHLASKPDFFDQCIQRILTAVVFRMTVLDRIEAAGMALLPMVAVDVNRSASIVQQLSSRIEEGQRLQQAFSKLFSQDILVQASQTGGEGRMLRSHFKKAFEEFVHEVHAFLVLG